MGAPTYAPNCTLRGEIGSSLMKSRILKGHLLYIQGALKGRNDLVKRIVNDEIEKKKKSKWAKVTQKYLHLLGLRIQDLEVKKKEDITKCVKKWDQDQWRTEVDSKKSLQVYRKSKQGVQEDPIYDNTPASVILFQARSNTLHLEDRKRHVGEETLCRLCQKEKENLVHFILKCETLSETREAIPPLQHPRKEDDEETLKDFLFSGNQDEEEMEKKKGWLYRLWKNRKSILTKQENYNAQSILHPFPSFPVH